MDKELLSLEQIRDFCEEALEMADHGGAEEALGFLIGDKLFEVLSELKSAQRRAKFTYRENEFFKEENLRGRDSKWRLSWGQNDSRREILDYIQALEAIRDLFLKEIKVSFEVTDIQDYLTSYPRLGVGPDSGISSGSTKVAPFSAREILSEVQDILLVEDIIRLFNFS